MNKNKILWILTLSPMAVTLALMPFMDDDMPLSYDINGNVTSIGFRYDTIIIPLMIILAGLAWTWILRNFNQRYENEANPEIKSKLEQSLKFTYNCAYGSIAIFILMQLWVLAGCF